MPDQTLILDIDTATEGKPTATPKPDVDYGKIDQRFRESLETQSQMDDAFTSLRSETYQQIAEAKRAGEPAREIMAIERAGLRKEAEVLTRFWGPFPPDPPAANAISSGDVPITELVRATASASERLFFAPYTRTYLSQPGVKPEGVEESAKRTTGAVRVKCDTADTGGTLRANAGIVMHFGLAVPTGNPNPLFAGLPVSPRIRQGQIRVQFTFSALYEAYLVAAKDMLAKSWGGIRACVFGWSGGIIRDALPVFEVPLWDERTTSSPGALMPRYSPTKTVTTDWFPVDSTEELHAYVTLAVRAEGHPNRDNSYADALGSILTTVGSIRVSQYLTD